MRLSLHGPVGLIDSLNSITSADTARMLASSQGTSYIESTQVPSLLSPRPAAAAPAKAPAAAERRARAAAARRLMGRADARVVQLKLARRLPVEGATLHHERPAQRFGILTSRKHREFCAWLQASSRVAHPAADASAVQML